MANNLLITINKKLLHLRLTEQFSWEAKTTGGMTLRFGGDDLQGPMQYRLENFTESYSSLVNKLEKKDTGLLEIHYVDLRYAKGFAIRTKTKKNKPSEYDSSQPCLIKYTGSATG